MSAGPISSTAAAIREGRLTAQQAVESALSRIEDRDGPLNAITALCADEARREAQALDRALAAGEVVPGPLTGVPTLVKDLEDVAGMSTYRGSFMFDDAEPATRDEVVPGRLRQAGAIVVGKSTLSEVAIEGFTDTPRHGTTRNPWNLERSPGGSSGGSGAALAAGMVPLATATDGGGSIRIPAAMCGLVGLKPTHGLIGRRPAADWIDFTTYGPLAATPDDLRLLLSVMAGLETGDPCSAPMNFDPLASQQSAPITAILAAERTSPLGPLPEGVLERLKTGAAALAELLGVSVTWIDPDDFFAGIGDPDLDWFLSASAEHVAGLSDALAGGRAEVSRIVEDPESRIHLSTRTFLRDGLAVDAGSYLAARRRRARYVERIDTLLADGAVLVTPTIATDAWMADGSEGPGMPVRAMPPEAFSTPMQNITGHPALSLPWGLDANGVPSGLQVTAGRWRDEVLLNVADRWWAAQAWPLTAPGYSPWGSDFG